MEKRWGIMENGEGRRKRTGGKRRRMPGIEGLAPLTLGIARMVWYTGGEDGRRERREERRERSDHGEDSTGRQ
jgi:hypothetical protein